uniref:Uncharacterized protein n=1 Tax=viral metagenome TaxID=1070528 RepID=A0A6M3LRN2_9ZZZZ
MDDSEFQKLMAAVGLKSKNPPTPSQVLGVLDALIARYGKLYRRTGKPSPFDFEEVK